MTRLLVIDGDVLAHKAAIFSQERVDWGDEEFITEWADMRTAKSYCDSLISQWQEELVAPHYSIGLSDPSRHYWRHDIYPDYKSSRRHAKGPIALAALRSYLGEKHKAEWYPKLEGDDVVGIIATDPWEYDYQPIIVSIDKDLKMLPAKFWNCDTEEWVSDERPDPWFHLEQTLTGDRVDNYPGCPGVGPKTAARLLEKAEGDLHVAWQLVVQCFEKNGLTEDDALTQARLAFILQEGWLDDEDKVILWTPEKAYA